MKCGSCRDTKADAYRKINPDNVLFGILKELNAARPYDPKYSYFCEKCISRADAKQAQKLIDVTDQNANTFTNNTTDNSSKDTSKRTHDSSNSSKDEYDAMVEERRVFSATGTPLHIPPKRQNEASTSAKPCPKRFKPSELPKSLPSVPENPDGQNPMLPNAPTPDSSTEQQGSEPVEMEELMMSTPSVEDQLNADASGDSKRDSESSSNKDGSSMNANASNSSFVAPEPNDNSPDASSSRLGSISPNVLEVSSTSPSRPEKSDERTRQPSTDRSDTESNRSKSGKRKSPQATTEKTRTQPTRRASADKSGTESDRSTRSRKGPETSKGEKSRADSRLSTSGKSPTDPHPSTSERDNPRLTTSKSSRTNPRTSTIETTTRPIDSVHDGDSDTASSHGGDVSTTAPPVKNPRIRQPAPMPKTVRDYFDNSTFDVNFMGRSLAG